MKNAKCPTKSFIAITQSAVINNKMPNVVRILFASCPLPSFRSLNE